MFRHLISVVRCACFEKKHSKTKISILCCLPFLRKQHEFKRSHFDIESPLLANGSYKIKIRVMCVVCVLKKKAQQNKNLDSVLFAFFLENRMSLEEAVLI